ncbi:MAG: isoprenyl transferase [SAR324 cluster bacterium]|nr:isoprenyl transferase [SAR324 cluster bacterium]
MHPLWQSIDKQLLPRHVGIIMDGNGRWAQQRIMPRFQGHRSAVKAVRVTVETSAEIGLKALTLYAFSTENWKRPQTEVSILMDLLAEYLEKELNTMLTNNIQLRLIGDRAALPEFIHAPLDRALQNTAGNTGLVLNLAVNYGGRAEIIRAVQSIVSAYAKQPFEIGTIDDAMLQQHLYTPDLPDPDLIIRTSGEYRISNFLLWQSAYAEFYFTNVLWPDFTQEEFFKALLDFQNRQRRMGGV